MKRGVLLIFVMVLLSSLAYAQYCDYAPVCSPIIRDCGCGGNQTRYTLCQGGCSDWYRCSVSDTESACEDGLDDDCDGKTDCADPDCAEIENCIDADDDGYPVASDCDDYSASVYPGAPEACNNVDDGCNGVIDESLARQCGVSDTGICRLGTETCSRGRWLNCDAILPGIEACNGLDDNCDGVVDEGCSCPNGATQRCGTDVGVCEFGSQACISGSWSACAGGVVPASEVCSNSLDDDCDGAVDDGCSAAVSPPSPAPEPATSAEPTVSPTPVPSLIAERPCIDADGDSFGVDCPKGFDCDDSDASTNPGAQEVCNGRDDDCDTLVDDGLSRSCGGSDIGVCTVGTERCISGVWSYCNAVLPSDEVCNNVDDNCDGRIDEGCDRPSSAEDDSLRRVLDSRFGPGAYSYTEFKERFDATKRSINILKSSKVGSGKTKVTIDIVPIQGVRNLDVFVYIPKSVAHSVDNIVFTSPPEVLQADPLVVWHFVELTAKSSVGYEVNSEVSGADEATEVVAIAESAEPISRPWYFNLLPILIIPVLGFVFVFLVEMAHRNRK